VVKTNEHSHVEKKTQIRGKKILKFLYKNNFIINNKKIIGEKRKEVAEECLLTAKGSVFNYVNNKIFDVIKDQDGNDDLAIFPGQVGNFRRIVGKCVHEFLHKNMVRISEMC